MHRRIFLKAAAAAPLVVAGICTRDAMSQSSPSNDWAKQAAEWRAEALSAFPYEHLEVRGSAALDEWEWLKSEGTGAPVVIGSDEDLDRILVPFHPNNWMETDEPNLAETLARADQLKHPDSLFEYLETQRELHNQWCKDNLQICGPSSSAEEQLPDSGTDETWSDEPPIGEWPERPPLPAGLTVAMDLRTGFPLDKVHIIRVPTDDWTTIPAYLRWGGWNANPLPEYHVAALRSWRDRYGAELVGLSLDVMNIRVATRPNSREEAMGLAREQYAYCNDIVFQGLGTLSNLAAFIKAHHWWFFWWD